MKKIALYSFFTLLIAFVGISQKPKTQVLLVPESDSLRAVSFTLDALSVVSTKCLGCHSPSARNEKSREALQWEKLQSMERMDAYTQLDKIMEVLDEGTMPPAKMVERYPGMKLSEEEVSVLKEWVETSLTKLEGK